jgi:hypothetical protein
MLPVLGTASGPAWIKPWLCDFKGSIGTTTLKCLSISDNQKAVFCLHLTARRNNSSLSPSTSLKPEIWVLYVCTTEQEIGFILKQKKSLSPCSGQ